MGTGQQEPDVFLNHDRAIELLEQSPDLVTRAILRSIYSQMTWDSIHSNRRPQESFDIGYMFEMVAKALTAKNLEAILSNPDASVSEEDFWGKW
jgi:hypothetical protein